MEELEFGFDASERAHFNLQPFKKMAGRAVQSDAVTQSFRLCLGLRSQEAANLLL